jgi:glycosyltransferase involved in cell wall biosynthesis
MMSTAIAPASNSTSGHTSRSTVSLVIPTLNEEKNVGWVLDRLPSDVDEVIIVDGRSTDGTIAAALRARPDAVIVEEPLPGKGAALRAGFARATGDFVVMIDADGSMHPSEIARYVESLESGNDLVKGSRFVDSGGTTDISRLRMLGNFGLLQLANLLYSSDFTELCYGFMAFRRNVLSRMRLDAPGFEIETQMVVHAVRAGLKVAEVPSFEAERRNGETHLRTFRDGGRVLSTLVRARAAKFPPYEAVPGSIPGMGAPDRGPRLVLEAEPCA